MITRRFLSVALNAALCTGTAALFGCNQQPSAPTATAPASTSTTATPAMVASSAPSTAQAPSYTPPTADQLYQLVAPIALFPDKLVAQVLAGATYPDQVTSADTFLEQNQSLQGAALQDAVDPQTWDPSVKGLTVFPKVLDQMAQNIPWTTALGTAYANDPTDVLNAIQVMRQRASKHGSLRNSAQLRVVDQPVAADTSYASAPADDTYQPAYSGPDVVPAPQQTIEILPADSDTVYVPEYDPQTVYGEDVQAYPSYRYEQPGYSTGDMVATGALAFGAGIVVASLFRHSHHEDRPDYGWNNWNMQWHGGDRGRGDDRGGDRGNRQRPSVVYNNSTYVSNSTTINNRYTTNNNINNSVNGSNNRINNGRVVNRPVNPPPIAGGNRPPPGALPAPVGPGHRPTGPAHAGMPTQPPMSRPDFNGALGKGPPPRFAHPGLQPGAHPGAPAPAVRPPDVSHQAHVRMPGVSAPGANRPLSHMLPTGQHIVTAAPPRAVAPAQPRASTRFQTGPAQHVAPVVGHSSPTTPRPQPPVVHRDMPHPASMPQAPRPAAPIRRQVTPPPAPIQQRVIQRAAPVQQREAPRPAPVQQRLAPRPEPMRPQPAAQHAPAEKDKGHPPKKDDKDH